MCHWRNNVAWRNSNLSVCANHICSNGTCYSQCKSIFRSNRELFLCIFKIYCNAKNEIHFNSSFSPQVRWVLQKKYLNKIMDENRITSFFIILGSTCFLCFDVNLVITNFTFLMHKYPSPSHYIQNIIKLLNVQSKNGQEDWKYYQFSGKNSLIHVIFL